MKKSSKTLAEWTPSVKKEIVRFHLTKSDLQIDRRSVRGQLAQYLSERLGQPISIKDVHHWAKPKSRKWIDADGTPPGKSGIELVEKVKKEEGKTASHSIRSTSQMWDDDTDSDSDQIPQHLPEQRTVGSLTRYQTQIIRRAEELYPTNVEVEETIGHLPTQSCSTSRTTPTTMMPIDLPSRPVPSSSSDSPVVLSDPIVQPDTDMNIQTPEDFRRRNQEYLQNLLNSIPSTTHTQQHLSPNIVLGQINQHPFLQNTAVTADVDNLTTSLINGSEVHEFGVGGVGRNASERQSLSLPSIFSTFNLQNFHQVNKQSSSGVVPSAAENTEGAIGSEMHSTTFQIPENTRELEEMARNVSGLNNVLSIYMDIRRNIDRGRLVLDRDHPLTLEDVLRMYERGVREFMPNGC